MAIPGSGRPLGEALGAGETLKAFRILAAMRGLDAEVLDGACHGLCAAGIVVEVQHASWPALTFAHLTKDRIPEFLSAVVEDVPPLTCFAGVAWNAAGWRGVPPASRHPFFARQRRVVMARCGHLNPVSLDAALLADGYAALAQVLDRENAGDFVEQVTAPARLSVSEEEGIPGLFTDRHLLEGDPYRVLEGLAIAAHAARANIGIIEIDAAARLTRDRIARALAKAQSAGLLGERILGSTFSLHVEIHEERRRLREEECVSSVAALAALPTLISPGDGGVASPRNSTTICGMSGPLDRAGIVEVDGAVTLRELPCDIAGGLRNTGHLGRALVVGPSGVSLRPESLDAPLKSLGAFSTGTGGVIAVPDDLAAA
jgi:NADH:ubiquinone oxidoreductase subunit F (NADH-binding)